MKKKLLTFLLFLISLVTLWTGTGLADVIDADSCSQNHVQTAINSANNYDVVVIPNGDCTWTSPMFINKPLTLMGNGLYSIDSNKNDTGSWPLIINLDGNNGIEISGNSGDAIRVTGIYFKGTTGGGYGCGGSYGAIKVTCSNKSDYWRIDNCKFETNTSIFVSNGYGLIDHTYHNAQQCDGVFIRIARYGSSFLGNESFLDEVDFGSSNFVFVEDNVFWRSCSSGASAPGAIDAQGGGRYVFRNNYVKDAFALNHGTESGAPERGGYAFEVYNNEFYWSIPNDRYHCAFLARGGTHLIYHNKVTNYQWLVRTSVRRADESWGIFGQCGEGHAWDGIGTPPGYPCLDQVGRGKTSSADIGNAQPQEPFKTRIWGNILANVGASNSLSCTPSNGDVICNNDPLYTLDGRDYEYSSDDSDALPGYSAYTYPHPFNFKMSRPNPPINLKLITQ